jgi:hypothetical protein
VEKFHFAIKADAQFLSNPIDLWRRSPPVVIEQLPFLVATACSQAPEGRQSWTMQLLADRLVELNLVENISDETVRLRLKKPNQTMVKRTMVHSPCGSRICLENGRCAGFIFSSL